MKPSNERHAGFEWIVPEDAGDICHLSVGGDYVGSIARNTENPSAQHQWSWRVTIPDSVDRNTPLAGQAADAACCQEGGGESIFACKTRESVMRGQTTCAILSVRRCKQSKDES
jgi:hypothetical protein